MKNNVYWIPRPELNASWSREPIYEADPADANLSAPISRGNLSVISAMVSNVISSTLVSSTLVRAGINP